MPYDKLNKRCKKNEEKNYLFFMTGKNIKNRVTILSSRGDEILSL